MTSHTPPLMHLHCSQQGGFDMWSESLQVPKEHMIIMLHIALRHLPLMYYLSQCVPLFNCSQIRLKDGASVRSINLIKQRT